MIRSVLKILKQGKNANVILVNTLYFEPYLANLILRKPILHKVVGDYAWERARNKGLYKKTIDEYQKDRKSLKLRFFDWYRTKPLKVANIVFAPSEYLRRIVIGWGIKKKNTAVVYNAVINPPLKRGSREQDVKKIITVCRLVSWKGLDELVSEISKRENVELHIVGDGPEETKLKELSKSLNATNKVIFHGRLSKSKVESQLADADVFVLNSSYEGLPHVILEAMLAKLPVICNDVGGCNEVVHHLETGFLMDKSLSSRTLGSGLDMLLSDSNKADELAELAYKNISENFSMEIMVNNTISLFDKVINN